MLESKYLKDDITNIKKLLTIPALRNFETRNLGKLLKLSKIRQYEDGEVIIQEGDNDPWLFFLLSGAVSIQKKKVEIAVIDQPGDIFGEMRIIDSRSRSATAVAIGKTMVLATNTRASKRLTQDDEPAEFLLLLYRVFAEFMSMRLRLTNEELVAARRENV